jgi:hypothetical protein
MWHKSHTLGGLKMSVPEKISDREALAYVVKRRDEEDAGWQEIADELTKRGVKTAAGSKMTLQAARYLYMKAKAGTVPLNVPQKVSAKPSSAEWFFETAKNLAGAKMTDAELGKTIRLLVNRDI